MNGLGSYRGKDVGCILRWMQSYGRTRRMEKGHSKNVLNGWKQSYGSTRRMEKEHSKNVLYVLT